jgi:hypothetical protein
MEIERGNNRWHSGKNNFGRDFGPVIRPTTKYVNEP